MEHAARRGRSAGFPDKAEISQIRARAGIGETRQTTSAVRRRAIGGGCPISHQKTARSGRAAGFVLAHYALLILGQQATIAHLALRSKRSTASRILFCICAWRRIRPVHRKTSLDGRALLRVPGATSNSPAISRNALSCAFGLDGGICRVASRGLIPGAAWNRQTGGVVHP